jgi:hypothetical protein
MNQLPKRLIIGSIAASGVVALGVILDLIIGWPFGGNMLMDILFLVSAAMIIYLGYDSYRELT